MYSYNDLLDDVARWRQLGLLTGHIGTSVAGRLIPFVHTGTLRGRQIIIQAGIHAREYATCQIAVRQLEHYARHPVGGFGIFWVPMSNPDGTELCQFGLAAAPAEFHAGLLVLNGDSDDFTNWKANLNGVDINTNFPARWGTGASNVFVPGPSDFVGWAPGDQPETRALMTMTQSVGPISTLSYHSRGQEIYYDFHQPPPDLQRDRDIAQHLAAVTGYAVVSSAGSAGGFKDYCIQDFAIPAYTVEFFAPTLTYPIDQADIDAEFEDTLALPDALMRALVTEFAV